MRGALARRAYRLSPAAMKREVVSGLNTLSHSGRLLTQINRNSSLSQYSCPKGKKLTRGSWKRSLSPELTCLI